MDRDKSLLRFDLRHLKDEWYMMPDNEQHDDFVCKIFDLIDDYLENKEGN